MYEKYVKRFFDIIIASFCLLFVLPILLTLILVLFLATKGNPLFFQLRPGKKGRLFTILKFKTMNDNKNSEGNLLPDDARLTKLGLFIRKTSLDELPQLVNVIKGDMSLIGPRPLLPEYISYYNEFQKKRHNVRPGITGLAQVNGRNAISWSKKFEYDLYYVNNISFFLDIKIIIKSFKKVFFRHGINNQGHVTMPTFIDYCKNKKND
jgi:undecaprenyl phosphate N,N'-diacetylbacillosamine 1-phosphate transferase